MTNIAIDNLLASCATLERRTLYAGRDYMHSSVRCFNACMRAFDSKTLPAEAVTFNVWLTYPVDRPGLATISKDGTMVLRVNHEA